MMLARLAAIISLVNLIAPLHAQDRQAQPELRVKALPYIIASDPRGVSVSRGSGVVVDARGTVLTALHVVQGSNRIKAIFQGELEDVDRQLTVACVVPEADIAVLRLPPRAEAYEFYPLVQPTWKSLAGDAVIIPGHPLQLGLQWIRGELTQNGYIPARAIQDPQLAKQHILNENDLSLLLLVAATPNGLSGAPVLTWGGEVAAILSGSYVQSAGFSWASPVAHLKSRLYQPLEKPAPNVTWPTYVFADLGRLRSLNSSIVDASPCQQAIDRYDENRDRSGRSRRASCRPSTDHLSRAADLSK